ncbi:hypothetical protein [Halobacteriovorax sp. JY17]|uniref:hypothetical protein n=1 Tax=Halobacteriovorax sp. JY17 TaxID=2014617 RepID=UPI0025C38F1B|nr:hypothetical protein [Halobacteriovorax sp. JY17]
MLFSINIGAASVYGGLGYSYGVVTAESDFWNGGDGSSPVLTMGVHFTKLAVELSYRSFAFENIHSTASGTYNIEISNQVLNLGLRYDLNQFSHFNFGLVSHSVDVEYTTNSSAALNSSSITGSSLSVYIGGGVHGQLFIPDLRWSVDVNYFHRTMEFGVFSFETGIFYSFYSF